MSIEIHDLLVSSPGPEGQDWELATTIYLPPALSLASGPNVLVLVPGGGYGRGYFNLPVVGASQAMYHAGRGNIVVTIDPLGSGESSAAEGASPADAAATLNTVVVGIVDGLTAGTLLPGLGPVAFGATIAAGHSLGGHLLAATQALSGTFKGIALLGSPLVRPTFPLPDGTVTESPEKADFGYAYHWGPIPQVDPAVTATDLQTLVGTDVAIGIPVRHADAPWASRTMGDYARGLMAEAAANAVQVSCEVLLVAGERDLAPSLEADAALFAKSSGVEIFELEQSAHLHNFAATAETLWKRVDTFIHHCATVGRRIQSTDFVKARESKVAEAEAEA